MVIKIIKFRFHKSLFFYLKKKHKTKQTNKDCVWDCMPSGKCADPRGLDICFLEVYLVIIIFINEKTKNSLYNSNNNTFIVVITVRN